MTEQKPLINGIKQFTDINDYKTTLEQFPPLPEVARQYPEWVRRKDFLPQIESLFLLGPAQLEIAIHIDTMLTGYYGKIRLDDPQHVASYYNNTKPAYIIPQSFLVEGQPGVGKTRAILQVLKQQPQVIERFNFPHFKGRYIQVVWFSISVSSETKLGFAIDLAVAWNTVLKNFDSSLPDAISASIIKKGVADPIFSEFLKSARAYNLGILHIDEIQSLFKSLDSEKWKGNDPTATDPIIIKKTLGLMNSGIPIIISTTTDGAKGLNARGAVLQRLGTRTVTIERFKSADDPNFKRFVKVLWRFQYTDQSADLTDEIILTFYQLTAGISRLIIKLFVETQTKVILMGKVHIEITDIKSAFSGFSKDLKKLVLAIHNGDEKYLRRMADYRY